MQVRAGYRLGQWRGLLVVGFWWLGQWQWGSILWEMVSKQALGALPLPSSIIKERISSWFSLGKTTSHTSEDSDTPSDNSIKSSISP